VTVFFDSFSKQTISVPLLNGVASHLINGERVAVGIKKLIEFDFCLSQGFARARMHSTDTNWLTIRMEKGSAAICQDCSDQAVRRSRLVSS
jgi:hypothetical protein